MIRYNIEGRRDCDGDEIPPIIRKDDNGEWIKFKDVEPFLPSSTKKDKNYRLLNLGERLREIDKEHYLDNLINISNYYVGAKIEEPYRFYREIVSYKDKEESKKETRHLNWEQYIKHVKEIHHYGKTESSRGKKVTPEVEDFLKCCWKDTQ